MQSASSAAYLENWRTNEKCVLVFGTRRSWVRPRHAPAATSLPNDLVVRAGDVQSSRAAYLENSRTDEARVWSSARDARGGPRHAPAATTLPNDLVVRAGDVSGEMQSRPAAAYLEELEKRNEGAFWFSARDARGYVPGTHQRQMSYPTMPWCVPGT